MKAIPRPRQSASPAAAYKKRIKLCLTLQAPLIILAIGYLL
jgi:hypothetical protein